MCGMPECDRTPSTVRIQTTVAGTATVTLVTCPDCDFIKCRQCPAHATSRTDRKCPNGHTLP